MLESEFTRGRCEPGETGSFPPLDAETFGFGLALAQSLPGPLFNLSAFLGAAVAGVGGGIVGFLGLFGPGILLIYALMPFWEARAAPASAPPYRACLCRPTCTSSRARLSSGTVAPAQR